MGIYLIVAEMPRQQCHQRTEVLTLSFIIAAKLSMAQSTIGRQAAIIGILLLACREIPLHNMPTGITFAEKQKWQLL